MMNLYCWEGYNQKKFLTHYNTKVYPKTFISDYQIAKDIKNKEVDCDVININNAFIKDYLWKYKLIEKINYVNFSEMYNDYISNFKYLSKWTKSNDNKNIIGIAQRFGSFNFVINDKLVSKKTAELNGFNLMLELENEYGVLLFEDFNIMHISLSAGINPFKDLTNSEYLKFDSACKNWLNKSKVISNNFNKLNKLLNKKNIKAYFTGGTFTCSAPRKEGFYNIQAITPRNKINNLKQGIIFTEITSVIKNRNSQNSEKFLNYIIKPNKSYEIAMSKYTSNPVLQMGSKKVFSKFSKKDLKIIQWEDLRSISRHCHDYQLAPNYKILISIFRKHLRQNKTKII